MDENEIGTAVIETAISVHRRLGPGLLESVYEAVLQHELQQRGLQAERQVIIPFNYQGIHFDEGFRADLIVAGKVIGEVKSVETVSPAHKKQLLTYLRLANLCLGYLLNFGAATMKEGITRIVNALPEE
jgi:GxxExxY protein